MNIVYRNCVKSLFLFIFALLRGCIQFIYTCVNQVEQIFHCLRYLPTFIAFKKTYIIYFNFLDTVYYYNICYLWATLFLESHPALSKLVCTWRIKLGNSQVEYETTLILTFALK